MLKRPGVASAKIKSTIERPQDGRNFFPEMQQQPGPTTGSEPRARKPSKPATQAGTTPSVFTTTHSTASFTAHFFEAAAKTPSKQQSCLTFHAKLRNQPIAGQESSAMSTRQSTLTQRITIQAIRHQKPVTTSGGPSHASPRSTSNHLEKRARAGENQPLSR